MLINPDEVVTGALVNAVAVVGRQISKAASGLRKPDDDLATARWFETFRLTGSLPDLPDLSPASWDRLAEVLSGDEIQAALQELLAVRLTDAPETDASRAREAVRAALSAAHPDAAAFAGALAGYYDDQVCALVARLEAGEPPLLAQIRSEAFSSRMISSLHAIERNTAARAGKYAVPVSGSQGVQTGDHNTQVNNYFLGEHPGVRGATGRGGAPAGWLLAEVTDPFALEVHRPVQADDPPPGLPPLPAYVARGHDRELAAVVRAAADGGSGIAVLVGGSSTGKTRACWEALGLLRERPEEWRLWHPIDPSRPEAVLRELGSIGPQTVIWLNDAHFYLDVAGGGLGERVAAGLRELLRDPARAPVLVLATLWPEFWDRLTARPPAGSDDPHAQARELLAGRDISVPAAFPAVQLQLLAAAGDPRLAVAAAVAQDGRVIQFLAGAPELVARYRNAPPPAAALIDAAMDARRLGMGIALPLAFLEAAAPGYLTDADWDGLGEDWLEQALAYTAAPCKGIRGPLARIRPRPAPSAGPARGPAYRLADYLEQHGRRARRSVFPPADFWRAAVRFATPADLPALAGAAADRGLLRDAARLRKHATARGDASEAAALVRRWYSLHSLSSNPNPARWAAAHAALDDPGDVAGLLRALVKVGAAEQAAALLARDPAAHADLHNAEGVAQLLSALREVGADDQANTLADRVAAHAALDDPGDVAGLLRALVKVGAAEQAAALLARDPAAHADLHNVWGVAGLLHVLLEVSAYAQAAALADRVAAHAALDHPEGVAQLLFALRGVGADDQVAALADRVAAHADLDHPGDVARLLDLLHGTGADEQAAALLARDPAAHAALDDAEGVAQLLNALREAGAGDQVAVLADRVAAHAALDYPEDIAQWLFVLREVGADEQAAALLARDPAAHAVLDHPEDLARWLNVLRKAGADDQVAALLARDPAAHAVLDYPDDVALLLNILREAGADDQVTALADRAAAHAALDDAEGVAWLLHVLWEVGADDQVAALADRVAAHAVLDYPEDIAQWLFVLREVGADEQAAALLARDPAVHAVPDNPETVAALLEVLLDAGAQGQAAALASRAAQTDVSHPAVAALLEVLREAGAEEQARMLVDRLPAGGRFDLFCRQAGNKVRYRFGREPDGSPVPSWGWDDLD
jgi:hypothetical protein